MTAHYGGKGILALIFEMSGHSVIKLQGDKMNILLVILSTCCAIVSARLLQPDREQYVSINKELESINTPDFDPTAVNFSLPWIETSDLLKELEAAFPETKNIPTVYPDDDANDILSELDKVFGNITRKSPPLEDSTTTIQHHSRRPIEYIYNDMEHTEKPRQAEILGCSNIFYEFKNIVDQLQKIVDFSNKITFNFENTKPPIRKNQKSTPNNHLFLRDIHISPHQYQSLYYDKTKGCLSVDLSNLKNVTLRNFARFLIFQKQMVEPLLKFESQLKALLTFKYANFVNPINKPKKVYVAKD